MREHNRRHQCGMSLLEIMIVIALIVGVMAVISKSLSSHLREGKIGTTKIAMGNLEQALFRFRVDVGHYPRDEEGGLTALFIEPQTRKKGVWRGPYAKKRQSFDAWGERFSYEIKSGEPLLVSAGPDGEFVSEDDIQVPEADEDSEDLMD